MDLKHESERATGMLKGKVVDRVMRHRKEEVRIEFTGGTTLFVDAHQDQVELAITEGSDEADGE